MELEFLAGKHSKFIERHLQLLPSSHQHHDPNKLAIIFYSIMGLSSLNINVIDRYSQHVPWLHKHYTTFSDGQQKVSGFFGSSLLDITGLNTLSLPNTYFALIILVTLKDRHFFESETDSKSIANFVTKCQLPSGSFVSSLNLNGTIASPVDSNDLRFCYVAVAILYVLGCRRKEDYERHINVNKLLSYVTSQQCENGGFGNYEEPHAGYTSCALSLLKLIDQVDFLSDEFQELTITWLMERQVSSEGCMSLHDGKNQTYDTNDNYGFQGRENKYADTCYCFWCLNSLQILTSSKTGTYLPENTKEYLLKGTQNGITGGFGKTNEDDSDIYHTYLALAALNLLDGNFDGTLCVPLKTIENLTELNLKI